SGVGRLMCGSNQGPVRDPKRRRGRLDRRVAIVTGAGRPDGIGAAIVRRFCEEGARVVSTDVLDEIGEATCAELAERGHEVRYRHLDVTSAGDWADAVAACREQFGSPSILVNNAGMFNGRPLHEEDLDGWRRTLDVNLTSVFLGMRAVLPLMRGDGGGAIVNTSSIWGVVAAEGAAAYHASKGGVTLLSKNAAVAYAGEGIRVNSVHPGGIETHIMRQSGQDNADAVAGRTPMGRLGNPVEIAEAVVFLASDEARYVTGTALAVDGGYTAL
ncbi:MAG TPA: glucose 1-dehydrogenase, partial [Conexibacter sp.]|nr:glucose 1-dehydrogenase [Conexibacter sp.]